jgi:tRNA threonylcarbamoyladenosine biosynthesis protein TsaE
MDAIFKLPQIHQVVALAMEGREKKKVWAFHAGMGTGKTTFIHALCEGLGVSSAISSPTFAIINEYTVPDAGIIYHMDWYRLKDEEEAMNAGVEDSLQSGSSAWLNGRKMPRVFCPEDTFHVYMEVLDVDTRIFTGEEVKVKSLKVS